MVGRRGPSAVNNCKVVRFDSSPLPFPEGIIGVELVAMDVEFMKHDSNIRSRCSKAEVVRRK